MARACQNERRGGRLLRQVEAAIRTRGLCAPGNRVLVAVSGGPDSVALLCALADLAPSWRLAVEAVHVHHGLRGAEADEDARFVAALCDRLGIPCRIAPIAVRRPASGRARRSIQESAREARYAALRAAARDLGADRVALGHTADDQAETLVMWMVRGAGTAGLAGIPEEREGLFIRPLLGIGRAEILADLEARGQAFRQDSSNEKPCYLRNRVRRVILPELTRFNPGLLKVLERQARILREDDRCLEEQAGEQVRRLARFDGAAGLRLDREGLLALPLALQRRVVRAALRLVSGREKGPRFGAVSAVLERVVRGRSGAGVSVHGAMVSREYGLLRFEQAPATGRRPADAETAVPLEIPSETPWPATGQVIRVRVAEASDAVGIGDTTAAPRAAVLDGARFTWKLVVRAWRPGDVFRPLGMGGHRKKLQDYFADLKLPRRERRLVPIIEAPEGILWVGGHRQDERFRPGPSTTTRVIMELVDRETEGGH